MRKTLMLRITLVIFIVNQTRWLIYEKIRSLFKCHRSKSRVSNIWREGCLSLQHWLTLFHIISHSLLNFQTKDDTYLNLNTIVTSRIHVPGKDFLSNSAPNLGCRAHSDCRERNSIERKVGSLNAGTRRAFLVLMPGRAHEGHGEARRDQDS